MEANFTEFELENYKFIYKKYSALKKITLKNCCTLLLKRAGIEKSITKEVSINAN